MALSQHGLAAPHLFSPESNFRFDFMGLMRRIRNSFDLQREKGGKRKPLKRPASALASMKSAQESLRLRPEGLAVTGTLLALGQLAAQTAAPAEKKEEGQKTEEELAEIVVEANKERALYKPENLKSPKFTKPVRDIPQTLTVVPEELIKEQNATNLRDVLRNVPGISMQAGEGGGGPAGDNLSIRGFAARSDIFVDGLRDTAGGGYSRDPFNLEQVEVAKGPASTNAGRGSTGGSINLSSKTPKLDSRYDIMLSGGTDNFTRGTFDVNQSIPNLNGVAFRLNGMYHEQDIPGRDFVENERWGIAPSIAFGLGTIWTRTTCRITASRSSPAPARTRLFPGESRRSISTTITACSPATMRRSRPISSPRTSNTISATC
jgi:outer membrane receptor for monomeric catechols